jgi:ABC-type amino acid transport substrate-binding protein
MKGSRAFLFVGFLALMALGACNKTTFDNAELVVGVECAYPPFNWSETSASDDTLPISNHSGEYADGFDIQVAKKLSAGLNKPVKIVQTAWTSLIVDLSSGALNCIISGMTDTAEREQTIDFSSEYYRSELVLVTKKAVASQYAAALTSDQLRTLVTGQFLESQVETSEDELIDSVFVSYGAKHAKPVTTFPLAASDVESGGVFAMTAELPVAESIVSSMTDLGIVHLDQTILGASGSALGVSVGLQKGNTELQTAMNTEIATWTAEWKLETMESALSRSSYLG